MWSISARLFRDFGAKLKAAPALGYICAAAAMLAVIALVLLISRVLIIPNAGVLYLLVVIGAALWLGTGPAVLAVLIAIAGITYLYAPLDADLALTATRLVVISAALIVGVVVARLAVRQKLRAVSLAEEADVQRKRFEAVVENALAGIAVLRGTSFRFELVNPAYQAIVPGKKLLGKTVAEAWPELADRVVPLLDRVFRTGEPYHATETPLPVQRAPDVPITEAYFTFSYIPMRGIQGRVDAILVLVVETTEHVLARKRIEEQRERAEEFAAEAEELAAEREEHLERLQELDRLKEDFLSVAAHELKTPVTGLVGFAQTLLRQLDKQREIEPDRLRRALQIIDRQAQKTARLIAQLLDTSRSDRGQLTLEREHANLARIARDVVEAAQTTTTIHSICVKAPEQVEALVDATRIEQVIAHLVDNAIRFSPHGGAIEVSLAQRDDRVEIAVRDHGIGIPPEHRPHLFERFSQAHSDDHRSGLGLGLYISNQIVTLHGGHIEVDQPQDGGSRFTVALPIRGA